MDILGALISLVILIYSAVLHEVAHGWVAYRLGDPTAKLQGRLTLNPKSHIDLYMSILLPLLLFIGSGGRFIFGGAKPVPVDPFNLRDGFKDLALVSLVGPLTNLSLAIIASIFAHLLFPGAGFFGVTNSGILGYIIGQTIYLNLLLAIFNLVPIPPLDGSKIFSLLLPPKQAAAYMSLGNICMLFLIFLLFFPIGGFSLMNTIINIIVFAIGLLGL